MSAPLGVNAQLAAGAVESIAAFYSDLVRTLQVARAVLEQKLAAAAVKAEQQRKMLEQAYLYFIRLDVAVRAKDPESAMIYAMQAVESGWMERYAPMRDDRQDQAGQPGAQRVGQEPVVSGPVSGRGEEATCAGGDVQAPGAAQEAKT